MMTLGGRAAVANAMSRSDRGFDAGVRPLRRCAGERASTGSVDGAPHADRGGQR